MHTELARQCSRYTAFLTRVAGLLVRFNLDFIKNTQGPEDVTTEIKRRSKLLPGENLYNIRSVAYLLNEVKAASYGCLSSSVAFE